MTLPVRVDSATATLAERLARLPAASSTQDRIPRRQQRRESASNVIDTATIGYTKWDRAAYIERVGGPEEAERPRREPIGR